MFRQLLDVSSISGYYVKIWTSHPLLDISSASGCLLHLLTRRSLPNVMFQPPKARLILLHLLLDVSSILGRHVYFWLSSLLVSIHSQVDTPIHPYMDYLFCIPYTLFGLEHTWPIKSNITQAPTHPLLIHPFQLAIFNQSTFFWSLLDQGSVISTSGLYVSGQSPVSR